MGVILSAAVLRAERRISRLDAVCYVRSLGPLVRTRALRDDALGNAANRISRTISSDSRTLARTAAGGGTGRCRGGRGSLRSLRRRAWSCGLRLRSAQNFL